MLLFIRMGGIGDKQLRSVNVEQVMLTTTRDTSHRRFMGVVYQIETPR
jgi:hypothetical protein